MKLFNRLFLAIVLMMLMSFDLCAAKDLSLEDVTSSLRAKRMSAVTPLVDGESYAVLQDNKKIVKYSFKTGKQTALLFDVNATIGEKVDGIDDPDDHRNQNGNDLQNPLGNRHITSAVFRTVRPDHIVKKYEPVHHQR